MNLGQAIDKLLQNQSNIYESIKYNRRATIEIVSGDLILLLDGEEVKLSRISVTREWNLIKKPVTFMEAINSGKYIKNKFSGYKSIPKMIDMLSSYDGDTAISAINGDWYIED